LGFHLGECKAKKQAPPRNELRKNYYLQWVRTRSHFQRNALLKQKKHEGFILGAHTWLKALKRQAYSGACPI
jgi:hypothetical protein